VNEKLHEVETPTDNIRKKYAKKKLFKNERSPPRVSALLYNNIE